MKTIEIEEDLYQYIASKTQFIGESATAILRRLLLEQPAQANVVLASVAVENIEPTIVTEPEVELDSTLPEFDKEQAPKEQIPDVEESNESVFNYINKEELAMQRGAVGRF